MAGNVSERHLVLFTVTCRQQADSQLVYSCSYLLLHTIVLQLISKPLGILCNTGSVYSKWVINIMEGHFFDDFYYLKVLWKALNVKMIEFPISCPFILLVSKPSLKKNIAVSCIRHCLVLAIFQKLSLPLQTAIFSLPCPPAPRTLICPLLKDLFFTSCDDDKTKRKETCTIIYGHWCQGSLSCVVDDTTTALSPTVSSAVKLPAYRINNIACFPCSLFPPFTHFLLKKQVEKKPQNLIYF